MKEILIAPNSFKECASSSEAARIIHNALIEINPGIEKNNALTLFPVSDGGDGFLETVKFHFKTESIRIAIKSILTGVDYDCPLEYQPGTKTLFVESAKVIGLNLIPKERRNPLKYSSAPLGELLKKIESLRGSITVENVTIGIGGTATSDLGIGMLTEFGLRLSDDNGEALEPIPANFINAKRIIKPVFNPGFRIKLFLDVENPLTGNMGAVTVFARQKGAGENELEILKGGFENLLNLIGFGEGEKLSGAGGGVAAAFQIFGNPDIIRAEDFILRELGLSERENIPSLVITGEGKLDGQTLMNKGGMIILNAFKNSGIPICFITGENILTGKPDFLDVFELKNYFSSIEESIAYFPKGIYKACGEISQRYLKKN